MVNARDRLSANVSWITFLNCHIWKLTTPTVRRAELDFSSSGQSKAAVTQLWTDDIQLINAVEYVNWGKAQLQFIVCENCGYVGCQPGGWVELKRAGSTALIMPAFTKIEKSIEDKNECLPPCYLLEKGAICIEQESYRSTLCQLAGFPDFCTLAPLFAWEAVKIFQMEAPNHILGNLLNSPKLPQNVVIASSDGNYMEQATMLVLLLHKLSSNTNPIRLRRVTESEQVISLYLDIAGLPEWKALSYNGLHYSIYLEPGYIVE